MPEESAAARFERDHGDQSVERYDRELRYQHPDRVARIYVAPNNTTPADDGNLHGQTWSPS